MIYRKLTYEIFTQILGEVPITFVDRLYGESKLGTVFAFSFLLLLKNIYLTYV